MDSVILDLAKSRIEKAHNDLYIASKADAEQQLQQHH